MPVAGHDKWGEALGMYETPNPPPQPEAGETSEASYKTDEIVELARVNLNMLGMLAMPTVFMFLFPKILLAAWQLITEAAHKVRDFSQIVLAIPRGHGKTTLLKIFILWCILFTKKKFPLIIAATESKAENIIADVMDTLKEPNIIKLFGDYRLGLEKDTQSLKKFAFRGRVIILAGIGAGTSLRGLNLKNERPDIMIFDDIQDQEVAESKSMSEAMERWMLGTAMKAKSPFGCLYLFVGNMYPTPWSLIKKLKDNPSWIKFLTGAILADGTALWPELHPIEQLKAEFQNDLNMGHPEIFFAEVLNNPEAGLKSKIDISRIPEFPYSEHDLPQGRFIVIDPATGKGSKGDLTCITMIDVYDQKPVVRRINEDRMSPGDCIRAALCWCIEHKCHLIAVESTAYQQTLIYWFEFFCAQLGIEGIEFVEVSNTQFSKNARITTMLSAVEKGEILLHSDVRSIVLNQVINWNPMKRDNIDGILDTITYVPTIVALYAHLMSLDGWMAGIDMGDAKVLSVEETCAH